MCTQLPKAWTLLVRCRSQATVQRARHGPAKNLCLAETMREALLYRKTLGLYKKNGWSGYLLT
jgi:hypothetical protein